jgi:glycosyltransferase involved in cell wall biosynthesis
MKINQVLPAMSYGDAVSSDAIEIKKLLEDMGYSSEIYAKYIHPKCSEYANQLSDYNGNSKNLLLYHFSLAGLDVTDFVKSLPDIKVLIYHNITPPEYFDDYDTNLSYMCSKGRAELKAISKDFYLGIGVSEYNRNELNELGFKRTEVIPIIINFSKYDEYDINLVNDLSRNNAVNFLFVGRIAPNKMHIDIIKTFYYYNKYINNNSRLFLVGDKQIARYVLKIEDKIKELGLSENVFLTGMVPDKKLASYYRSANIFLCMSEHEGFCVPLLEAMYFRIPVIAYASTGIPYTLNDAGILLHKKNYIEIAELANIVINNKLLSNKLVKKQEERCNEFNRDRIRPKLNELIKRIISIKGDL